MKFLSDLITDAELTSARPGYFNVIKANTGSGKTTFAFNEKVLKFAREKHNVLYLIHNKTTRDFIALRHRDEAQVYSEYDFERIFVQDPNDGWACEEPINKVCVLCYQTFAAYLRNYGVDWLSAVDLIIWDEFDDVRNFYHSEVKKLRRALPKLSKEQAGALLDQYNDYSVAHFIKQVQDYVLAPGRITLLALSATPEVAALLFQDTLNYLQFGAAELSYDALQTIYISNIQTALNDGTLRPAPGQIYWCFTPYIHQELAIKLLAEKAGFKVLVGWNKDNPKFQDVWTDQQTKDLQYLTTEHKVPDGYDFVIMNGVLGRGVDIFDERVQDWIYCGSTYEDSQQFIRARFQPARKYLPSSMRGLVEFIQNGIPAVYYEWHTVEEMRQLIELHPLFMRPDHAEKTMDNWETKPFTNWSAAKKYYEKLQMIEMRRYGRSKVVQYRFVPAPVPSVPAPMPAAQAAD